MTIHNPEEPEYFPEVFPRDAFPRYTWDDGMRPLTLPHEVWLSETTHRDGQQGGLPLSLDTSRQIYDILCEITGESTAIRHAEFFPYRDSDRNALIYALERHRDGAPIEPTTWIRARREDVELIKRIGVTETGLLSSSSDYHTFHKFGSGGRTEAAAMYLDAVAMALDHGIKPRVHLEDTTRSDPDFVRALVEEVLKVAAAYPAELQPRFRVCDTLGIGLPYDDVALPRSIPRWIRLLRGLDLTPSQIEFHPHNDTWLVVANCLAAIREGCGVISGTTLGTGERTGNAPLEAVMVHLLGMGYWAGTEVNLPAVNKLVEALRRHRLRPVAEVPAVRPGRLRHPGRHPRRRPQQVLVDVRAVQRPLLTGRELDVALTKDSGQAGLLFVLDKRLGLRLEKGDPRIVELLAWMDEQWDAGRVSAVEWNELEPVVEKVFSAREEAS